MHTTSQPTRAAELAACARGCAAAALLPGAMAVAQDAASSAPAPARPGNFRGYSGVRWPTDFQVRSGHCDRKGITESPRRGDAIASLGERRSLNRTAAMRSAPGCRTCCPRKSDPKLMKGIAPAWAKCWNWVPAGAG